MDAAHVEVANDLAGREVTGLNLLVEEGRTSPEGWGIPEGKTEVEVPILAPAPVDEDDPTGWKVIDSLRGIIKGAPPDVAENHDFYLYGRPRQ